MDVFNKYLVLILSITSLLFSFHALAEDDYMTMLETEAKSSQLDMGEKGEVDVKQRKQQIMVVDKKWQGECDYAEDVLLSAIPREEFSSYLKQCSLSLFVFYRKLDVNSQTLVYEEYRQVSPVGFSSLKKTIVNYL